MKNFKLLLATTAILSAGAIVANAETTYYGRNSSVNINADVIIVGDLSISSARDISFGVIAPKYTDESDKVGSQVAGTITISPDGEVTTTNLTYFGRAHSATYGISTPTGFFSTQKIGVRMELPTQVVLKDGNTECGTMKDIITGSSPADASNAIGATFEYKPGVLTYNSSGYAWNNLHCTATFTATLVLYDLE